MARGKDNHGPKPIGRLPNGATLYVKPNEVGGHTYMSDEVGCGIVVWDTALVDERTLEAALEHERMRKSAEMLTRAMKNADTKKNKMTKLTKKITEPGHGKEKRRL